MRVAVAAALAIVAVISSGCGRGEVAGLSTEVDRDGATDGTAGEADGAGAGIEPSPALTPEEVAGLALVPATTAPVDPSPTPVVIPSPTPTPTPHPIERRTMLFSGDVLSHEPVIAAAGGYGQQSGWAYDYRPMFDHVRDRVSRADLAICVLETPVSPDNTGLDGYPTFNAPRELVDALVDAGYDGCSTASNHSMDRGAGGVKTTLEQMDRVGLGHSGMARSESEWATPTIYDLDGLSVAHLSYSYSLNGFVLPQDEPWLVNLNDVDAIVAEADRAREAGADLVVLSIQWGNEYQRSPSADQLDLAQRLTASGRIDLIAGNHVHVVQPVDWVNGVPVVYGVGNSLSNQYTERRVGTQDGVMIEATAVGNSEIGWRVAELAYAPTWVDRSTYTIIDLIRARADEPEHRNMATWTAAFDRTVEAIGSAGAAVPLAD